MTDVQVAGRGSMTLPIRCSITATSAITYGQHAPKGGRPDAHYAILPNGIRPRPPSTRVKGAGMSGATTKASLEDVPNVNR